MRPPVFLFQPVSCHAHPVTDAWGRVAETVKRRRTSLGLSQRQAARLADDISPTTWQSLETHGQAVSDLTAAAMCRALGWREDSFELIRRGRKPIEDGEPPRGGSAGDRLRVLEAEMAEVKAQLRGLIELMREPRRRGS